MHKHSKTDFPKKTVNFLRVRAISTINVDDSRQKGNLFYLSFYYYKVTAEKNIVTSTQYICEFFSSEAVATSCKKSLGNIHVNISSLNNAEKHYNTRIIT